MIQPLYRLRCTPSHVRVIGGRVVVTPPAPPAKLRKLSRAELLTKRGVLIEKQNAMFRDGKGSAAVFGLGPALDDELASIEAELATAK